MECEKEMTYYCERSFGGGENEKHECKSYKKNNNRYAKSFQDIIATIILN